MFRNSILFAGLLLFVACEPDTPSTPAADTFDREAMLEYWANGVIVPAFESFSDALEPLGNATDAFLQEPTEAKLEDLRNAYRLAYVMWQATSPFMTGPGEDAMLRERLNTYPADTEAIDAGAANYELPSTFDQQGFPALDYLLHARTDELLNSTARREQLAGLVELIESLTAGVLNTWTSGYADTYVANSGNSATASIDRTVNDLLFYYERSLRAGKVGIPAGAFSNTPLPDRAEAPYAGDLSRALLKRALDNFAAFFAGNGGPSLEDYLDALGVERDGEPLSARIRANFATASALIEGLDPDLATQVATDNTAMLRTFDALQQNVILLKVDMLQALGINVDYVDADGD